MSTHTPGAPVVSKKPAAPIPLPSPLVPLSLITAYVNGQGNDGTGAVGDRAKPFLTLQAACNATPNYGIVYVEDIDLVENVNYGIKRIIFRNSQLTGNLNGSFLYLGGDRPTKDAAGFFPTLVNRSRVIGIIGGTSTNIDGFNEINGRFFGSGGFGLNLSNIDNVIGSTDLATTVGNFNISYVDNIVVAGDLVNSSVGQVNLVMNNVNNFSCVSLIDNFDVNFSAELTYCKGTTSDHVINGLLTNSAVNPNTKLKMNYSEITTTGTGRITNLSGGGAGTFNIETYFSIIRCAAAEMIAWVGNPAGGAIVKSTSNMNKQRNILGVVNQTVNNDHISLAL